MRTDLMLPCEGGPTSWMRVPDPPPLEVEVENGVYVFDDEDGDRRYVFLPT